jgi:hypothetical protein
MVTFIDQHRDTYGVEPLCAVLPCSVHLLPAEAAAGHADDAIATAATR